MGLTQGRTGCARRSRRVERAKLNWSPKRQGPEPSSFASSKPFDGHESVTAPSTLPRAYLPAAVIIVFTEDLTRLSTFPDLTC